MAWCVSLAVEMACCVNWVLEMACCVSCGVQLVFTSTKNHTFTYTAEKLAEFVHILCSLWTTKLICFPNFYCKLTLPPSTHIKIRWIKFVLCTKPVILQPYKDALSVRDMPGVDHTPRGRCLWLTVKEECLKRMCQGKRRAGTDVISRSDL